MSDGSTGAETTFPPLSAHGLVGDLRTAALVAADGTVDWFPVPHVESPSVFASILDADGGRFAVTPTAEFDSHQRYRDRTNVLDTAFRTANGRATLTDFMPVADRDYPDGTPDCALYRRVSGESGTVELRVSFAPAFDYARRRGDLTAHDGRVRATGGEDDPDLSLTGAWEFEVRDGVATATATLDHDETRWLILTDGTPTGDSATPNDAATTGDSATANDSATPGNPTTSDPATVLAETLRYWRGWAHDCPDESACVFGGPWHDEVVRSGLLLKLLTHHETGAIAAAPTTSLPEDIGGVRNWDYRYNWIRDAAFTAQALYNLGHETEAKASLSWFTDRCHATEPSELQPLYGLHGETDLDERLLDHLAGYRDSAPVRVGNAAEDQLQLDVYGELVDAAYEITRYGLDIDRADWRAIREIVSFVAEVWDRPDAGIWEVRCEPKQFVHSKVMCWVALDRGIEMLDNAGFDGPRAEWVETRDDVRRTVLDRGYDEDLGSFVRAFGSDALDAANLLLPMLGFLPFDDDRVQGTIDATIERLTHDGLVARYEGEDGLPGEEGAFLLCSFWLIDALALSGRRAEARRRFRDALEYVGPTGLLAEEVDPATGDHLGNTPQAFSHIGLINSALYLGRTGGRRQRGPEPKGTEASPEVPDGE